MTDIAAGAPCVCIVRRTREITSFATGRIVDPDAECPTCRNAVLLVELGQPDRRVYDWPRTAPTWLLTPHEWTCDRQELVPT